jgi:glutamate racemase
MQSKPSIGVMDSGIGGLTFVQRMIDRCVDARYVYISDAANVPYGNRPQAWMLDRMTEMSQALKDQGVDVVLLACNTATAETIDQLRTVSDVPLVGIEPYMRHRHLLPNKEQAKYALILTPATRQSARFQALQTLNDPENHIQVFALPHLALLIEQLKTLPWAAIEEQVKTELKPLQAQGFTHLILGCTHYGIIQSWLAQHLGVEIVNPIDPVIDHLLEVANLQQRSGHPQSSFLYSEDRGQQWASVMLNQFAFLSSPEHASSLCLK